MQNKFHITKKGYEKLVEELKHLKYTQRPLVSQLIATAREHGDLSENAEYSSAKEKQSFLETKIGELETKLSNAQVIEPEKLSGTIVKFGATVTLKDLDTEKNKTYHIAGEYETNIDKGLISVFAPISQAMIGKNEGDIVVLQTASMVKEYQILKVEYKIFEI